MRTLRQAQSVTALIVALTLCINLAAFDTSRNILWLITAAVCSAYDWRSLFAYRFVFGLQLVLIFLGTYSVSWNVYSIIRYIHRAGR